MSLDVSLKLEKPIKKTGTGVFFRENGMNVELTKDEVMEKFPNTYVDENEYESEYVFQANITHNLNDMAEEAGIYEACWRPYRLHRDYVKTDDYEKEMEFENSVKIKAVDILPFLQKGYEDMEKRPDHYKKFDSPNGWGLYVNFLPWVKNYLDACKKYPEAIVEAWR